MYCIFVFFVPTHSNPKKQNSSKNSFHTHKKRQTNQPAKENTSHLLPRHLRRMASRVVRAIAMPCSTPPSARTTEPWKSPSARRALVGIGVGWDRFFLVGDGQVVGYYRRRRYYKNDSMCRSDDRWMVSC